MFLLVSVADAFCGRPVFHHVGLLNFVYTYITRWIFGLFPVCGATMYKAAVDIQYKSLYEHIFISVG